MVRYYREEDDDLYDRKTGRYVEVTKEEIRGDEYIINDIIILKEEVEERR